MSRRWFAVLVLISLAGCGDPPLPHVDGLEVGLNDDNFQSEVLDNEQPVLVDFGGEDCPWCVKMDPVIAHASLKYDGRVKFGKVDVGQSRRLAAEYDIGGIPALVLFHHGQEIDRAVGYHSLGDLSEWLDDHVPNTATN